MLAVTKTIYPMHVSNHRFKTHHGTMSNKQQVIMNGQVPIPHQQSSIHIELPIPTIIETSNLSNRNVNHLLDIIIILKEVECSVPSLSPKSKFNKLGL